VAVARSLERQRRSGNTGAPRLWAVRIAIISDTHLPRGARRLPEACVSRLRAADLIIHAGDLSTPALLEQLQNLGRVVAVQGNVDDERLRATLPRVASVEAEGAGIVVLHNAGPARGRLSRMRARFPEADAVIFGHSHMPVHEQSPEGFQIFNPGSPTDRRRAPSHTMGVAFAKEGSIAFRLVALD
jgi:uncharacterized protein